MTEDSKSAIKDVQIGGTHYKGMALQPMEVGFANSYDDCTFSALKYVMRHAVKDGREGLLKAQHCIELRYELIQIWGHCRRAEDFLMPDYVADQNGYDAVTRKTLHRIHHMARQAKNRRTGNLDNLREVHDWVKEAIGDMIETYYPEPKKGA